MAKSDMGNLFITFLLIVIGLALTGTVATSSAAAVLTLTGETNTAAAALCALIPMFWVIIILAIGVAAIYVQFKGWGK